MQAGVGPAALQQFRVPALLHDVAVLHDEDRVGVADRGQAVRDDEACPTFAQPVHRLLHQQLGAGVHRARRLIEDEDGGVGDEGARDRQKLALTSGDIRGVLLQDRLVALREGLDDVVDEAGLRGRLHVLIRGAGPPIADVLPDRPLEQPRVLQHHPGPTAHLVARHQRDVPAVEGDVATVELVEAHEQVDQGGLPRAGRSDDRHRVPRLHAQGQVPDELGVRRVGEAGVLHLDDAGARPGGTRHQVCLTGPSSLAALGVRGLLLGVEKLEDSLGRGRSGLHCRGHPAELAQRLRELLGVLDEGLHIAQAQRPRGHHDPADHRDGHIGDVPDDQHERHHDPREELGAQRRAVELVILLGESLPHRLRAPVDPHEGVTGEGLLHTRVDAARARPLMGEGLLGARPDHPEHSAHERDDDERHQRQLPGDREHHPHDAHDGEDRGQRPGQRLLEGVGDVVDVVGDAGEHLAALHLVEVGQRQAVDLGLHLLAQPVHGGHGDAVEQESLQPHEDRRGDVQHEHRGEDRAEATEVDALARPQVHGGGHIRHVALPRGAQALDDLLLRDPLWQARGDDALEDDVRGVAQHLGRGHGQHDPDDARQRDDRQRSLEGGEQADHAAEGGPEGLGLARGRAGVPVVGGRLRGGGELDLLLAQLVGGGARALLVGAVRPLVACVAAHAATSCPSWEETISWYTSQVVSSSSCVPVPTRRPPSSTRI